MVVRQRSVLNEKSWIAWLFVAVLVVQISGEVEWVASDSRVRDRRSPQWLGSSKKTTSSGIRATTRRPLVQATTQSAPIRHTTPAHHPTTHGPIRKATTQGLIYPHPKPVYHTTTPRPVFHTTPQRMIYPTQPPPIYPVPPNRPPVYVPPPPPGPVSNPTIIIIRDHEPAKPTISPLIPIIIGGAIGKHKSTPKLTTTTTTTTTTTPRTPKTTTEEPWQGIEGGYDRKTWTDFVKSTQRKDIPLSGQWVRIRGGKSMREGYVEILGEGGLWGSVCDVIGRWDIQKANIVCRQLGYRRGAEAAWQGRPIDNTIVPASQVREVNCGPSATSLLHCNLRRSKEGHFSEIDVDGTCYGRTRNIGVRCRPEPNSVCKFGEKPFGNSCYRVVLPPSHGGPKDLATIGAEAVKACRSTRSELVSVTTQAENDFLSDWLQFEYPSVDTVMTSGIGTHSRLGGLQKPLVEWWLWSGQYRDVDYEKWWPGWSSKPTITPIVPPKSMMCILLQNKFPLEANVLGPPRTSDYFFWKAYTGTSMSVPLPFICERPADDVGCLPPNQEYIGPANITESGKACLKWSLQEVRNSPILANLYVRVPSEVHRLTHSDENQCRRVTLDKEPWCFVSPGAGLPPQPEQCIIPICGLPASITSYYEAPSKTNSYAPTYNQIPSLIEPISYSSLGSFSRSALLPSVNVAAPPMEGGNTLPKLSTGEAENEKLRHLLEAERTMVLKTLSLPVNLDGLARSGDTNATVLVEEQHTRASKKQYIEESPERPEQTIRLATDSEHLPVSEVRNHTATNTNSSDPVEITSTLERHIGESEPVDLPKANDTLRPAHAQSITISTTESPVLTEPSLSYPHPENEIVLTTEQTPRKPQLSLHAPLSALRMRYAAGKGRPFERQLSSSDMVLILNGLLPTEDEVGAAEPEIPTELNDTKTTGSTSTEQAVTTEGQTVTATEVDPTVTPLTTVQSSDATTELKNIILPNVTVTTLAAETTPSTITQASTAP